MLKLVLRELGLACRRRKRSGDADCGQNRFRRQMEQLQRYDCCVGQARLDETAPQCSCTVGLEHLPRQVTSRGRVQWGLTFDMSGGRRVRSGLWDVRSMEGLGLTAAER